LERQSEHERDRPGSYQGVEDDEGANVVSVVDGEAKVDGATPVLADSGDAVEP